MHSRAMCGTLHHSPEVVQRASMVHRRACRPTTPVKPTALCTKDNRSTNCKKIDCIVSKRLYTSNRIDICGRETMHEGTRRIAIHQINEQPLRII
jgi:hypothetical protein